MAYRKSELGFLVRFRPEEAKKEILGTAVIGRCRTVEDVAHELGISRRALFRYLDELKISDELQRVLLR
jgi:hypothetical protein